MQNYIIYNLFIYTIRYIPISQTTVLLNNSENPYGTNTHLYKQYR